MKRDRGVAYCGLACCVCGENETCSGCRSEGCAGKDWCMPFRCCRERKLAGCWECEQFPCENPMFTKLRVRAFAKLIGEFGADALMDALEQNEKAGAVYHDPGQLTGDYDRVSTEAELRRMLGFCGE